MTSVQGWSDLRYAHRGSRGRQAGNVSMIWNLLQAVASDAKSTLLVKIQPEGVDVGFFPPMVQFFLIRLVTAMDSLYSIFSFPAGVSFIITYGDSKLFMSFSGSEWNHLKLPDHLSSYKIKESLSLVPLHQTHPLDWCQTWQVCRWCTDVPSMHSVQLGHARRSMLNKYKEMNKNK